MVVRWPPTTPSMYHPLNQRVQKKELNPFYHKHLYLSLNMTLTGPAWFTCYSESTMKSRQSGYFDQPVTGLWTYGCTSGRKAGPRGCQHHWNHTYRVEQTSSPKESRPYQISSSYLLRELCYFISFIIPLNRDDICEIKFYKHKLMWSWLSYYKLLLMLSQIHCKNIPGNVYR